MPEWCPRCNAMLPEGLQKCPRCGKKLNTTVGSDYSMKDIFGISSYVLMIVLIPVILVIIIGLVCVALGN
jgi:rRNA maturation protein Nop10